MSDDQYTPITPDQLAVFDPEQQWIEDQLNRIDPHRHEQGAELSTDRALRQLVRELELRQRPDVNLSCKATQKRLATTWGYVQTEQQTDHEQEAIDAIMALIHESPDKALGLLAGSLVGLLEVVITTKGGDSDNEIEIKGGERKITIHAAK
jgi:hypothetical protein